MATSPVGRGASAFNVPAGLAAIQATDAEFHRLHTTWRALEDAFEVHPGYPDEDPESAALYDRASAARDAMFARPVSTATALALKLEAVRDGCSSSVIDMEVAPGLSVLDAIERDCQRIAAREVALCPAGPSH